ncbi:fumarylacetoacetate hydrolase family protein [Anaerolentibacter hominis]|uniref:fumarylacetoacetate hydrolase family protein n=1 Tax=Anaerolentibacter hominis TaxID=3079009 RepID=UPI0031B859D0
MKLVTFRYEGTEMVGVLNREENGIYPVSAAGLPYASMNELILHMTPEEKAALGTMVQEEKAEWIPADQTEKMAPIPRPIQDVVCLGINYTAHAEEAARYQSEAFGGERPAAIYFSKRVNQAVADGGEIDSHPGLVERLDYEAELGVIIGKDAKNVPLEEAFDYVFGYTVINDVSARVIQTKHKQWYFGKSLDTFTPMGPCITTADEIAAPPALKIQAYVNGALRQDSNTSLLINDIPHVISELSQGMTLEAGTVIATGTPAGVGMGMTPPTFLKPGDEVTCYIEGIGKITNKVK